MAEKIEFDLIIKNNQLLSALNDNIKKADSLGSALTTALGVVGGNLATKGFEMLGSAISNAIEFGKESVKAFSEQEDAINALGQALRASGEFSNAAVDDFNNFASALQRTSIYGDEVVLSQLAVAKSFGATNNQSKALVQAAANLSATFGGSLDGNVEKLGKTLNGTIGKLAQFIPELKTLTKEQLAAGEAANIINEKFGGAAASQLNTYSGSVTAAANSFSDMQEEIGRFLAKNSFTIAAISGLNSGFKAMGSAVKDFNDALGIGVTPIQEQQNKLKALGDEYNQLKDIVKAAKIQMETNIKYGGEQDPEKEAAKLANIASGESRLNQILQERIAIRRALRTDEEAAGGNTANKSVPEDTKTIENRQKLNNELLSLDKQLELEREQFAEQSANLGIQNEGLRNQQEVQRMIEYEQQKIELDAEFKNAEAQRITDESEKQLTLQKIAKDKELALIKAQQGAVKKTWEQEKKDKENINIQMVQLENQKFAAIAGIVGASANLVTAVTKDGSKEAFFATKAAALAQAIVYTQLAATAALAVPPAPNFGLASLAEASGAINIAAIAAQTIKGFATGGIIGGGDGATMGGDNTTIRAREGEMMLNGDQQRVMWDILSGNSSAQPIIIKIDEREIARAVRNQKNAGYKI